MKRGLGYPDASHGNSTESPMTTFTSPVADVSIFGCTVTKSVVKITLRFNKHFTSSKCEANIKI